MRRGDNTAFEKEKPKSTTKENREAFAEKGATAKQARNTQRGKGTDTHREDADGVRNLRHVKPRRRVADGLGQQESRSWTETQQRHSGGQLEREPRGAGKGLKRKGDRNQRQATLRNERDRWSE
ncbi:Hypothetical predicted protein [Pelobates cultripes]|uniref:Uncharacterized protein n=1 Tax=Pelobates cultripes TaxID=61616 RepID=A0AAD1S1F0_PELCU|nr:Hypothetical predicted protein [Pelobates cultripes]